MVHIFTNKILVKISTIIDFRVREERKMGRTAIKLWSISNDLYVLVSKMSIVMSVDYDIVMNPDFHTNTSLPPKSIVKSRYRYGA